MSLGCRSKCETNGDDDASNSVNPNAQVCRPGCAPVLPLQRGRLPEGRPGRGGGGLLLGGRRRGAVLRDPRAMHLNTESSDLQSK